MHMSILIHEGKKGKKAAQHLAAVGLAKASRENVRTRYLDFLLKYQLPIGRSQAPEPPAVSQRRSE